jgi:hypothetical protein
MQTARIRGKEDLSGLPAMAFLGIGCLGGEPGLGLVQPPADHRRLVRTPWWRLPADFIFHSDAVQSLAERTRPLSGAKGSE